MKLTLPPSRNTRRRANGQTREQQAATRPQINSWTPSFKHEVNITSKPKHKQQQAVHRKPDEQTVKAQCQISKPQQRRAHKSRGTPDHKSTHRLPEFTAAKMTTVNDPAIDYTGAESTNEEPEICPTILLYK